MKVIKIVLTLSVMFSALAGQDPVQPLAERIKQISEGLLEGYAQPVVTAFGTAVSTGLFHSAYSHDFLGFDLSVRAMYIQIPNSAKYYDDVAVVCSLANGQLVSYEVHLDSISTIFGPEEQPEIPAPGNAVGIPPNIPTGFDVSGVPFIMPQLNVGFILGSEIFLRYVPFSYKGSSMRFLGFGAKQEINKLPFMKNVPLPVAIAIGGAYQTFGIKDSLGEQIVNTRNWCLQVLVSKRLGPFEPVIGAGIEDTKAYIKYQFQYEIPDTINNIPEDRLSVIRDIDVELKAENSNRIMAGFNLNIGFLFIHYDYNIVPYQTHNAIIGFKVR
jgi:hypothetical protein